jgi:hypothetical protein
MICWRQSVLLLGIVTLAAACTSYPVRTGATSKPGRSTSKGTGADAPAGAHTPASSTPGEGAAGTAPSPGKLRSDRAGMPSQFVSLRYAATGASAREMARYPVVAVSNSRTGAIIRRLLPGSRDGMQVVGLALDRAGNLWVTYSRGPVDGGDVLGGDPRSHSCANEIMVAHGIHGRLRPFLRTGNNVLISGAVPSPNGRLLAYRESGCATGYFNNYLRVVSLVSYKSWTIGAGLPRCHWVTDPQWSRDGSSLIVGYAPAGKLHYTGPQGSCAGMRTERLVELSATAAQGGLTGAVVTAAAGCQITSAAGLTSGGVAAIEACGGREARFVVLSPRLRPLSQFALGRCTDGNELSPDLSGRQVLVSAYLFCNPPGKPGPATRLWSFNGRRLRLVTSVPGGNLSIGYMTW